MLIIMHQVLIIHGVRKCNSHGQLATTLCLVLWQHFRLTFLMCGKNGDVSLNNTVRHLHLCLPKESQEYQVSTMLYFWVRKYVEDILELTGISDRITVSS